MAESHQSSDFDGEAFLKDVSAAPGVYAMVDSEQAYLYVGKARNLKNRLSSYFRSAGQSPKTKVMMRHVANIELMVTHTENEALILENNLIKTHRPRYNVVFRDDKSYPYIHFTTDQKFPRLAFYRGNRKQKGRFFGPYPGAGAVRETLSQLQKIFLIRQCEDTFFRNRSRPCLQYQIKRCSAPCVGLIGEEEYAEDVKQATLFLEGKDQSLTDELVKRMDQSSQILDFETAATLRDRIKAFGRVQEHQYVDAEHGEADVIGIHTSDGAVCIHLIFIRHGRNIGSKNYYQNVSLDFSPEEIVTSFVSQHYLGGSVPKEILVSHKVDDQLLLEQTISRYVKHKVDIKYDVRGHRAKWLKMAVINAEDLMRRRLAGKASQNRRLDELQQVLSLDAVPDRIECFDISHTAGERTVASCVVFDSEGPVKSEYRRFNIKDITPGDDYAAMAQVLHRRYQRVIEGEGKIPDLILIDGGRGQLAKAEEVLNELQLPGLKLVGVAKGRTRRPGMEKLFPSGENRSLILDQASPALHLIQQIRDEAHRFAITGHRQRRGRARTTSPLEQIPGVGEKRRQRLLKQLGGLQEVARAGIEDLSRVPGISQELAKKIYMHFHEG